MGRAKLNMELISKEKSRNTTFFKRKKGLKKKIYEFSTLCDVDACLIILGPNQGERPAEPEIWPENPDECKRVIDKYKELSDDERGKRNQGLKNFFEDRKKKMKEEIAKLRLGQQGNTETKFPTWDDRLESFTEEELRDLLASLDSKLQLVKRKVDLMNGKQSILDRVPGVLNYTYPVDQNPSSSSCVHQQGQSMAMNGMHPQQHSWVKPLDYYSFDPMMNPTMNGPGMLTYSYPVPDQNPASYVSSSSDVHQGSNMGMDAMHHQPISWVKPLDYYPSDPMPIVNESPMMMRMNGYDYGYYY